MNLTLSPKHEALIRKKVDSGQFTDESDVVAAALRLMYEHDRFLRLKAAAAIGDEQYERGEVEAWTENSLEELMREADEEDRLGIPIRDEVKPQT